MISTNHIVTDIEKIPSYWVFEYYLSLSEKLTGQDIKIKSIWNTSEKTASMSNKAFYPQRFFLQKKLNQNQAHQII